MPVQEACRVCGNPLGVGCGFGICGRQDVVHDGTNGRFVCVRKDMTTFRGPLCDLGTSTIILDGKEYCRREDGKFYENVRQRHFVCPVCKKGFHLSTPGVYQDGVGGFFCSKACIERHPVLDDDDGLRASLLALESVKPLAAATIPPNETEAARRNAKQAADAHCRDQDEPRSLVKAGLVVDDVRALFAGNPSLRGRMRVFVQVEVDGVGSSEPLREIKIGRDAAGEPILVLVVDQ